MKIPETFKEYTINKMLPETYFVNARASLIKNNINNLYDFLTRSPIDTATILSRDISAWLKITHTIYQYGVYPTPNRDGWTDDEDKASPLVKLQVGDPSLNLGDAAVVLISNNIQTVYDITFMSRFLLTNLHNMGKVRYTRIAEAMWKLGWVTDINGVWKMSDKKPEFKIVSLDEFDALVETSRDILYVEDPSVAPFAI